MGELRPQQPEQPVTFVDLGAGSGDHVGMTGLRGRALSQALREPVDPVDQVAAPDLADRVGRRHRRHRALQVAAAAVSVLVVIAGVIVGLALLRSGGTPRPSVSVEPATAAALRDAVHGARFTRTVTFDGGALTLTSPPAGRPALAEAEAIAWFRSTGQPMSHVLDVVVGYATATLRDGLNPGGVPGFAARPAWVVVYHWGPHSCPAMTSPGSTMPEGRHVFLLDPSTSRAVDYQERGAFCGQLSGPRAAVATSYTSLPWTQVIRGNGKLTFTVQPRGCEQLDGWGQNSTDRGDEFFVYATRPMAGADCPLPPAQTITADLAASSLPLIHAATGPVVGLYTRDQAGRSGFGYYDGRDVDSRPATAPAAAAPVVATEACRTRNLALGFGGPAGGMTGERAVSFTLTNNSKTGCRLLGYPRIDLLDSNGKAIPFRYVQGHTRYVTSAPPRPVALAPGGVAYFLVAKYRCDGGELTAAADVNVTLPGDATTLTGRAATAGEGPLSYCQGATNDPGQVVAVSPVVTEWGSAAGG